MKRFTKFFLLMMTIVFSSSLLMAQISPPISVDNPKVKAEMTPQKSDLALQKEQQRLPVLPDAQNLPLPENSRLALIKGKTFKVPEDGSRANIDIQLRLTVDYFPSEATYNLWSVSAGAYYWGTNQTFTLSQEVKTHILSLTEGGSYRVDCFDSYGDGGISGVVSNVSTGWPIISWAGTSYTFTGQFPFVAGPGSPPPPGASCTDPLNYGNVNDGAKSGTLTAGASVWYTVTSPGNMNTTVSLCGSSFDSKLDVYSACGTTALFTNDDFCGLQSQISKVPVGSGQVWYVRIYGYSSSSSGAYTLTITGTPVAPPPNDVCTSAQFIGAPYPKTINGTTNNAFWDCLGVLNWNAVWYTIDLPYPVNNVTIDFCGTAASIPTIGIVYYNDCSNCGAYNFFTSYGFYSCGDTYTNPKLTALNVPGPGTIRFPAYVGPTTKNFPVGMDFQFTVNVTSFGDLHGHVTNYYGLAISGAEVKIPGLGLTTYSAADGYYEFIHVPAGPQQVTCSKTGYNFNSALVDIIGGSVTTHDFIMTQPNMVINPLFIEETLNPGEYFTTSINILNNGTGPLGWAAEIVYPEAAKGSSTTVTVDLPAGPSNASPETAVASGPYKVRPASTYTLERRDGGNGEREGRNVLLVASDGATSIRSILNGYGDLDAVDYFNAQTGTPTLDQLMAYQVVVTWTNYTYSNPTGMGNVLADYVDAGGKVINLMFSMGTHGWQMMGRFMTEGYTAMDGGGLSFGTVNLGTFDAEHPIMEGITSVSEYYCAANMTLKEGATAIANWNNGNIFVAAKEDVTVVSMNGYVGDSWMYGGQMPDVLHNSINWLLSGGGGGKWLTMDSYEGIVPAFGGTANIPTHLDASGTSAGEVYTADIVFTSDPDVSTITVPVTMFIYGPELIGPEDLTVTLMNDILGTVSVDWVWNGDSFLYFLIKRDGAIVGTSTTTHYTDILPTYGVYCYTVQAIYDEGQTPPAGPECLEWPNPEIFVTPMSLEGWVWPDHQVTVYTTIYNNGIGTLAYAFPDFVTKSDASRASYCYAYGGDLNYINNVKIGDIDNSTGYTGYGDYSSTESTDVEVGSTHLLTVSEYYAYFPSDECGVWVDWNQDGDFTNDGAIYVQGSPGIGPFTANITVPDNALVGPTRMRIRAATYGGEPLPCGYYSYGEVEDYTLNVTHHFITTVVPAMGKIAAGASQQIAVTYSAEGFYVGNFYEDLTLTSNDADEGELIIANTMHVYAPGQFAGVVTDRDSGDGLPGVTVTAGTYQTTTDDNGEYSLYVNQGNYNVVFQKLAYISVTVSDTFALAGIVTPLDVKMWDANYPPGMVHAEVMNNDSLCHVTWTIPAGPYEIVMDDGEADDYFIWAQPGSMNAVKFTPLGYPATAIGGQIYVGDGSFPGPFIGTQFGIALFDDDGPNGLPGTMLDSNGVTVNNYGWVSFDWLNATFEDGSFYLAMIQTAPSLMSAPLGVDLDDPTYYKSYSLYKGAPQWVLSPVQDFMIRAWVDGSQDDDKSAVASPKVLRATPKVPANWQQYAMTQSGTLPKILPGYERNDATYKGVEGMSNRDVTNYRIGRYSNFDPDGSPAAGTLTELATTANLSYNDNAWVGLPQGWYAYGVKALYTSGLYSDYTISNIVGHKMDFKVTVNVTLATGQEPINVEVSLKGLDFPYLNLFAVTPASGTVVFDPVWKGHYDITAFKIGYETYTIGNTSISADKTYNIILSEKKYPPTCLTVDPVSLIATWCEPLRTAVSQDFEDPTFPPAGWQISTEGDFPGGWFRTEDGSSANFPIPAWDSFYACANDDAAGTDSDGCCDYLITPALDLRESEGYALSFDSYYDGAFGQLAFVEYSVDGGSTWEVLYQVMPATSWTNLELDLSAFSGLSGAAQIWFAFHTDDAGEWASGWAVDNVKVQVPAPAADWLDFWVFLDDTYKGVTTETTWNYAPLLYGHTYTASVAARYVSGLSSKNYYKFSSLYLFPPDSLEGIAPDDAAILQWWPPWELWPAKSPAGDGPKYSNEPAQMIAGAVADANAFNRSTAIDQVISSGSRDFGDVLLNWPVGLSLAWGLCDDGENLWISDYNSPFTLFQYTYEGENTGETLTVSEGQVWIGDMVSDGEFIYCCLVGGSNAIAKVEIATGDVTQITGDFAGISQRGLAADFVNEEFYIGGWNENLIYRTDFEGNTIDTYSDGTISGLAWHPQGGPDGEGSLWVMINAPSDVCTEYDPNNGWASIQSFVIPNGSAGYCGAAIELKRSNPDAGALWVMNQADQNVYLVDLDEPLSVGPVGGLPANLLGYNVYRDGHFVVYREHTPAEEYVPQGYVDEGLQPGIYQYTVTAVYDLTPYGLDGQTGESMEEGPAEVVVDFCYDLEFMETWSLGNFDDNKWLTDGSNWSVNGQAGNPAPAAEFSWDPIQTNYESSLTSYPLCAVGMTEGKIWLDFDLKLDAVQPTGEEMIHAQVWNWDSKTWSTVAEYSNVDGSFDWMSEHINIKGYAMDKVFKIRFQATGVNSLNIESWFVDNIHVYRACDGATELTAAASNVPHGILLNWLEPEGSNVDEWIHWDDGVNSGNSIGTGGVAEFDVAARWEPAQLATYEGASVTQIAFFPAEPTATYRVRVWVGAEAANLVVDQAVNPISLQWNTVTLATPVPIDITQELWVGYYINTQTGYPAGVDDGPAIDGYGNMMNFGGWQTLLEINPDLDYNWNISAHIVTVAGVSMPLGKTTEPYNNEGGMSFASNPNPNQTNQVFDMVNGSRELSGYNIYRNAAGGEYALIDFTPENTYLDPAEDLIAGTLYCYMVSAVWASETDLCESPFSNEACELWTSITDPNTNTGSFSMYPNPASDHVYITASDDLKRVTVYNALGQLVMDEITTGKQYELKTTSYTIGVYMVRVETAAGVTTRTLTIQR